MQNGAVVRCSFDDRNKIDQHMGRIRRALDERRTACPGTDRFYELARRKFLELNDILVAWRREGKE